MTGAARDAEGAREWMIQVGECFYFDAIRRQVEARLPETVAALRDAGIVFVVFDFHSLWRDGGDVAAMQEEIVGVAAAALRQLPAWALPPRAHPVLFAYMYAGDAVRLAPHVPPLPLGRFGGYLGELEGGVDVFTVDGTRIGSMDWDLARDYLSRLCRPIVR